MKHIQMTALALMILLLSASGALSCINVELKLGVADNPGGHLIGDIVSTLVLERSGVKALITYYKDAKELDQAVADKQVDIMVENTANALAILGQPLKDDMAANIMTAKILYKRDKGLIWLKPFGYGDDKGVYGALVTKEILDKFPGMPRVLGKLSGAIDNKTWEELQAKVTAGGKTSKVAKDFLVAKKFI